MQCIYQAAKAPKNGAFGAKNKLAGCINITFLILPDQEGCFREYIFDQLLILQMS